MGEEENLKSLRISENPWKKKLITEFKEYYLKNLYQRIPRKKKSERIL